MGEVPKTTEDIKGPVQEQVEFAEDLKPQVKTDYSGAQEKTDPREIALVKKLDRWIMVRVTLSQSLRCTSSLSNCLKSLCFGACTGSTTLIVTPLPSPN
jgi:hypothetical protein